MSWVANAARRNKYYRDTAKEPPSELVLKTLQYGNFKTALDIGCGSGADTKEMATRGITVTAVDVNSEIKEYIHEKGIDVVISPIENFTFGKYDLIYAKSSLVFLVKSDFYKAVGNIKDALNPGGICALRLWGQNHSDNNSTKGDAVFVNKESLTELLSGLDILEISEREKDGADANGRAIHWHFIDVIAKK